MEIETLRLLCRRILSLNRKTINVRLNYYWTVGFEDAYQSSNNPPQAIVGSFSEDWEWLKKILLKETISTTLDFERLGNVIYIVGLSFFAQEKNTNNDFLPIKIEDIRTVCELLFSKTEAAGFKELKTSINQYWKIKPNSIFNFSEKPEVVNVPLIDDWDSLKFFLDFNKKQPSLVDFETLGRIIKIVGELIDKSEKKEQWLGCNL